MGNCTTKIKRSKQIKPDKQKEELEQTKSIKINSDNDSEEIIKEINNKNNTNKKAVLIGLNYVGTSAALKGCINDAERMKETLKSKFGYKDITILTDNNLTKNNNILQVLDKLISSDNKIMYFQYSGHGVQRYDRDGDEEDGKDEALYSVGGTIITDDEINLRVRKVKPAETMILVIDACHSGTIIDLPYQLQGGKVVKINDKDVQGKVICITGCRDEQVSMDVQKSGTAYGAMSNAFQTVIHNTDIKKTSWKLLIGQIQEELKKNKHAQVPQLCVSHPELINSLVEI